MPPVAPTLYRGVLALIGTPDESIEQMVGADDSFLDGPDAHTHIITLRAAGLIHPRLEVVERGAVQLVIKVGFHPLPIGHQMFCPHKVLEARLIDVEQTRLGIGLHLPADKTRDVLRRYRYRPHEDDGQDDQLFHTSDFRVPDLQFDYMRLYIRIMGGQRLYTVGREALLANPL